MKECELFNLIPREKLDYLFENSTAGAELDSTFLAFEEVYKGVLGFVPKSKIIIDLGCAYATQSWYFRDYKKYIGVDFCTTNIKAVLNAENAEFYFVSIQKFIKEIFNTLGISKEDVFAICSYVPDEEARQLVRETFPYCLVYYPTNTYRDFAEKIKKRKVRNDKF